MSQMTLMRLLRFARLTILVRVLCLRLFRELAVRHHVGHGVPGVLRLLRLRVPPANRGRPSAP
eukprot:9738376-Heterocapsa_arctica.AAC.1